MPCTGPKTNKQNQLKNNLKIIDFFYLWNSKTCFQQFAWQLFFYLRDFKLRLLSCAIHNQKNLKLFSDPISKCSVFIPFGNHQSIGIRFLSFILVFSTKKNKTKPSVIYNLASNCLIYLHNFKLWSLSSAEHGKKRIWKLFYNTKKLHLVCKSALLWKAFQFIFPLLFYVNKRSQKDKPEWWWTGFDNSKYNAILRKCFRSIKTIINRKFQMV